jgi:dinuclear metal center YbgI/SA1388 family protein
MHTVATCVDHLEQLAPPHLAAEWDNVGLLVGDPATPVERVMTCLTVTPEVVAEAIDERVHLIVTHHPVLFRPSKRLTTTTAEGRMLWGLVGAGVAVYSPHTAFDNCRGGINDIIAGRLGLTDVQPLRRLEPPGQCKVVVFVPEADLERVADAMFEAGAGHIGQYSQCSFRLAGTGTFFGSEESNPTIGQRGKREQVSEWRLEVLCGEAVLGNVLEAMRAAHSYEEPAYDIYPLRPTLATPGAGRVGRLPAPVPLADLARQVKSRLNAALVQVVGDSSRPVQRVAIACGAGGELLNDAVIQGADVFVTGELRFHDLLAAQAHGLAVLLPGHYASERCGVEELAKALQAKWADLRVWASRRERDPITQSLL